MLRRLLGRLLTLAAGVSLALCVAMAGFWIWSAHDPSSDISPTANGYFQFIEHDDERVSIGLTMPGDRDSPPLHRSYSRLYFQDPVLGFFIGTGFANITWNPAGKLHAAPCQIVSARWASLVTATISLPGLWLCGVIVQRMRRRTVGFCRVCGYDLRATPNRCPECGTPVSPTNTSKGAA